MGKEKRSPTHSQIAGIVWITAALTVILIVIFFSRSEVRESAATDTLQARNRVFLDEKEDSVYRSRREHRPPYQRQHPSRHHAILSDTHSLYTSHPPAPTRQPLSVELNSADTTTLQLLHGIGPAFARRIVNYRERLGGFVSTAQLLEVYGFTPELLSHIAPHLRLDTTSLLRRIPVNSATLKQLIRHPYVEYYFARDLVNLRSHGVTFSSAGDLRLLPSASDTMLAKLIPYLDFSLP